MNDIYAEVSVFTKKYVLFWKNSKANLYNLLDNV